MTTLQSTAQCPQAIRARGTNLSPSTRGKPLISGPYQRHGPVGFKIFPAEEGYGLLLLGVACCVIRAARYVLGVTCCAIRAARYVLGVTCCAIRARRYMLRDTCCAINYVLGVTGCVIRAARYVLRDTCCALRAAQ
ncbi:hypothetical protein RRG08_034090 [Elysia crispata]|uniref:Uncharacterized protein n=1 Tax=Elysia crispata TaxID=231223 RepID=A0AAE1D4F0_9GAST|nr:hypothetical protein RRG08_034090 [Elysia crispata]